MLEIVRRPCRLCNGGHGELMSRAIQERRPWRAKVNLTIQGYIETLGIFRFASCRGKSRMGDRRQVERMYAGVPRRLEKVKTLPRR